MTSNIICYSIFPLFGIIFLGFFFAERAKRFYLWTFRGRCWIWPFFIHIFSFFSSFTPLILFFFFFFFYWLLFFYCLDEDENRWPFQTMHYSFQSLIRVLSFMECFNQKEIWILIFLLKKLNRRRKKTKELKYIDSIPFFP